MTTAAETIEQTAAELGLAMDAGRPIGIVEDGRVVIRYAVTLTKGATIAYAGPYTMGIGFVKPEQRNVYIGPALTEDEKNMMHAWARKPHADFKDKDTQAALAAKLAIQQKVKPTMADLLSSLVMDSGAIDSTFEDWASNYGYDVDSRKAEATYRACLDTAIKLRAAIGEAGLVKLREACQDY